MHKAVVLAAGKSTRIAAIAGGLPKPLVEIGGKTILERNLCWLRDSGITDVWINLHYRPDAIRSRIGDGSACGVAVNYACEPEILGTAGGVRAIASKWRESVLVVYGDSLLRADLGSMERAYRMSGASAMVGLFDRARHPHTGIAGGTVTMDRAGRITNFNEGAPVAASSLVNAGIYLLEPEVIAQIPPHTFYDFGRDLFPKLLESGTRLAGYLIDGYCLGIDTPEAYARALELIRAGRVRLS